MLQQSACPSCGAPVVFDAAKPQIQCAYCRSALVPLQRGNEITLEAVDKVNQTLERTSIATQSAIADAQRVTQFELERVRLSQELSALETRLGQVQSERRTLAREPKKSGTVRHQIQELQSLEVQLLNRSAAIEKELGVARPTIQRVSGNTSSCGRIMLGSVIWVGTFAVLAAILPSELAIIALVLSVLITTFAMLKIA